ncbi:hypothetical protein PLICRDRAFT_291422 [Plicaturopsis crispa FD-325 SS-3]|nr:hypothetical protein PLICRDRAFT_291422 [Plicaturopsis crispa FD-325 SS-3]
MPSICAAMLSHLPMWLCLLREPLNSPYSICNHQGFVDPCVQSLWTVACPKTCPFYPSDAKCASLGTWDHIAMTRTGTCSWRLSESANERLLFFRSTFSSRWAAIRSGSPCLSMFRHFRLSSIRVLRILCTHTYTLQFMRVVRLAAAQFLAPLLKEAVLAWNFKVSLRSDSWLSSVSLCLEERHGTHISCVIAIYAALSSPSDRLTILSLTGPPRTLPSPWCHPRGV